MRISVIIVIDGDILNHNMYVYNNLINFVDHDGMLTKRLKAIAVVMAIVVAAVTGGISS